MQNGRSSGVLAGDAPVRSVLEFGSRRALVTAVVIMATMLEIIDTTIVNVALPNIQGNFGVGVDEGAWIVTGYIIANVIAIPIAPWLESRFGRRVFYVGSILLFTFASAMCGLSNNFTELVLWRVLQGFGGGGLLSIGQAILRQTYPDSEQGKAQGIFSIGVVVGPALGPLLGGIVTDSLSWRWAFFVNIPVGIAAALVAAAVLRNPSDPRKRMFDWIGVGLLAAGLGSLQYVFEQGQRYDWFSDGRIVLFTLLAVVGVVGFVAWTLRSKFPAVDLHILRNRSVVGGSFLGATLGMSLYGTTVILPQYVQNSLGFTATLSGELIAVRALVVMLCIPIISMLVQRTRVDTRLMILCGFLLVGISNWMLATVTTASTPFGTFFWALALSGVGLSGIFIPLSVTLLGSVKPSEVSSAASFFALARQVGGSFATALLVTVLVRHTTMHQSALAGEVTLHAQSVFNYLQASGGEHSLRALRSLASMVVQQAMILSYADTSRLTALLSVLLAPLVFLLRRRALSAAGHR